VIKGPPRSIEITVENFVERPVTADGDYAILAASQSICRHFDGFTGPAGDMTIVGETQPGQIASK
jgi:hypothetical protein